MEKDKVVRWIDVGEWNTLKQQQGFSDDPKKKKSSPQTFTVKSFGEVIAKHDKKVV